MGVHRGLFGAAGWLSAAAVAGIMLVSAPDAVASPDSGAGRSETVGSSEQRDATGETSEGSDNARPADHERTEEQRKDDPESDPESVAADDGDVRAGHAGDDPLEPVSATREPARRTVITETADRDLIAQDRSDKGGDAAKHRADDKDGDVREIDDRKSTAVVTSASGDLTAPAPVAGAVSETPVDVVIAPPPTGAPPLANLIGSMVLNLLMGAIHLIDGPPTLPPGSTVTVRTSTLDVPVAGGRTVQADWYFPKDADQSTRLIYLQHGFMASGPMYSYTAARIAERTNSIVVAPSLSSNFFDPAAAWVGGDPMHRAVAELFVGDREALVQSARAAAGYQIVLPQTFAFVGHSAGGTLVTAAAGYLARKDELDDLVGLVLLDGVEPASSRAVSNALSALTGEHERPIYLVSSPRYFWSRGGDMADKLQAARPDRFNGVSLVGGLHTDYSQSGNMLLQFAQYVITGFSAEHNVQAAADISIGWLDDLFDGTRDGLYGAPGQSFEIATRAGTAEAVVFPLGPDQGSPLQRLVDGFFAIIFDWAGRNVFVYEPMPV
ncbi:alpha/beta hydrolase [Mycolicibacterium neoaurum]|uniref:alpha/beta hydrolase n=1 Tax=Mycolicibacterium neoaurum TaxID=1795 RepID=UPI001F4CCEC6|nr:alpha/beta hydrolase [Mycolicibacterium neoaurum]